MTILYNKTENKLGPRYPDQYKVKRWIADVIFYCEMKIKGFKFTFLYFAGVRIFGSLFY